MRRGAQQARQAQQCSSSSSTHDTRIRVSGRALQRLLTEYTLLPVLTVVLAARNVRAPGMHVRIPDRYAMYAPEGRQYLVWKRTPTKKTSKTGWDLHGNKKSWSRDSAERISQTRKSAWPSISVSFGGCSGTAVKLQCCCTSVLGALARRNRTQQGSWSYRYSWW